MAEQQLTMEVNMQGNPVAEFTAFGGRVHTGAKEIKQTEGITPRT